MSATDGVPEITPETRLKLPNRTAIATYEDDIVVSGVADTKTISGETATLSRHVIEASDGQTPLRDIVDTVGDEATTLAIAEALCGDDILYPAALLDPFDVESHHYGLLESLLLAVEQSERAEFASAVRNLTVDIRGEETVAAALRDPLSAIGCPIDDTDPDVLVFCEGPSGDEREAVNHTWLDSDATLVRARLSGASVSVGPVLTQSSPACLACLTTREELNDAGERLNYHVVGDAPSYGTAFLTHVLTRLSLQAGLGVVPAELVGHIVRLNVQTLDHGRARLLGVPGCEACDERY